MRSTKVSFLIINLLLIIALATLALSCDRQKEAISEEVEVAEPQFEVKEGVIGKGDFFMPLLTSLGATYNQADSLLMLADTLFDPRKMRGGQEYQALYLVDSTVNERKLAYFIYHESKSHFITFSLRDSLYVERSEREQSSQLKYGTATIESSLWNDLDRAGMSPLLALRISDIYAWSIDFFALRAGDFFNVLYEELYIGGEFFDIGAIYAVEFTHAGELIEAYQFEQDGIEQYWNEKGENLRKAFLKAPLNFTRISSGFSYARRHPVTRVVRPHTGVDYAAPHGTPVVAIGDGVVTQRNYAGAGGNTVRIKHNSTYTTAYLHLSRFAKGLTVGKRVKQGEVIGYVGATGTATGPHLDFRVWKHGTPINPLTMKSPPADPIKAENQTAFEATIVGSRALRDSLYASHYLEQLLSKIGVGE